MGPRRFGRAKHITLKKKFVDFTLGALYSGGGQASSTVSALVWDEETGWRRGDFVDGAQGRRTVLTRIAYLGGGVLPRADELAHRAASPTAATARRYRSRTDLHDGLDDALRRR